MDVLERDFFTDSEILQDPTPYYAALRERGPAWREPHQGVVVLSGIEEILEAYADHEHFDPKRWNVRRDIAFGHGEHFCPGASLARTEVRVSFERLLGRLDDVQLLDPSALSYAPTFIIRGLTDLPLRFRRRG